MDADHTVEPAADRELAGFDPFDLLTEEAARIEAFVATLDEAGWHAPSACAGWDRHDLLAHLASSEDYNHACLDDDIGGLMETATAQGVTDVHTFNDWGVRTRRDRPPAELIEEWATAHARTRSGLRARDGNDLPTLAGPYPARLQAWHLAAELATHADDLGIPVDPAVARHRMAWRAHFARFVVAEEQRGAALEPAEGGTSAVVDGEVAVLDDDTLVAASTGRLADPGAVPPTVLAGIAPAY